MGDFSMILLDSIFLVFLTVFLLVFLALFFDLGQIVSNKITNKNFDQTIFFPEPKLA